MKNIYTIILSFVSICFFANDTLVSYLQKHKIPYENRTIILVGLNGNDCINCYKAFSNFFSIIQESKKEEVYFILGGINAKEKSYFLNENFPQKIDFKNLLINNEFSYYLNKKSSSVVYIIDNGKIVSQYTSKTINSFDFTILKDKSPQSVINYTIQCMDSLDVSNYIWSNRSSFDFMKNGCFLLTDFRKNIIYKVDRIKKQIDSFEVVKYLEKNYIGVLKKRFKDDKIVKRSLKIDSESQENYITTNSQFISINTVGDKVHIGYRYLFNEEFNESITITRHLMYTLILDANLKPIANIPINISDLTGASVSFDVMNPHFSDKHSFFRVTSDKSSRDTLFAKFSLKNNTYTFDKFYRYQIPSYIPKTGTNGYPMFYFVEFYINGKDTFIYTGRDYVLTNLNTNQQLPVSFLKDKCLNDNENYFLCKLWNTDDKNVVWHESGLNKTILSVTSSDFKSELSHINIDGVFSGMQKTSNNEFCGLKVNESEAKLYFYRVVNH